MKLPRLLLTALLQGSLVLINATALAEELWATVDTSPSFRESFPADGVELGRGWFQHRGRAAPGGCIKGERQPLKLSEVNYTFEEQTSREQTLKALNVGAAARYGAFSATASFAQSSSTDRSKLAVLAVVHARKGGEYLAPGKDGRLSLDPGRRAALAKVENGTEAEQLEALRQFIQDCGDSYVSAIEKGGLYASRFERSAESALRETLYGATANGGFGRFRLSLSMSNTTRTALNKDDTRINTLQQGGELTLPLTAGEAYDRIAQFANRITEENASSQTLVLRPYESHPDFPKRLANLRTSGERINQVAGLADRFATLSEDYLRAYFTRYAYQFPFQQIEPKSAPCVKASGPNVTDEHCLLRELYEESVAAGLMADCLESVVQWCREDSVCNLNRIPATSRAGICLSESQVSKLLEPQLFTTRRIAGGSEDDPVEAKSIRQRILDRIRDAFAPGTEMAGTASAAKGQLKLDALARQYLAAVARLPLNSDGSMDDLADAMRYCKLIAGTNCSADNLPNKSEADLQLVNMGLREWVFAERLGRVVQQACKLDVGHPLCTAGDSALSIAAGLMPQFKSPRRFKVAEVKPAIAVQPPPSPPRVERCGGGGGGYYPGSLRSGGGCN